MRSTELVTGKQLYTRIICKQVILAINETSADPCINPILSALGHIIYSVFEMINAWWHKECLVTLAFEMNWLLK